MLCPTELRPDDQSETSPSSVHVRWCDRDHPPVNAGQAHVGSFSPMWSRKCACFRPHSRPTPPLIEVTNGGAPLKECMDPILMNDCTASVVTPVQHYTCHSRRGMFLR